MNPPSPRTDSKQAPAGLRPWLGRLALAIGVPLLLFGTLELALRAAGYGYAMDFFIPDEQPGIYRTNPHFTDAFFPASFGLKPVNFRLPKEKPAGETRIFVLGESAAMGVPEPGFGLAPQLQAQLRAAYPDRVVRVYNLGVTAINSHAIVPIALQALTFHPDLLVFYMGNNEVVGPFGPSSVVTGGVPPRLLIRLALWLRRWRTTQLLAAGLQRLRPAGGTFKDWRGMEMFAGKAVPADDPRLARTYANFGANLDEILDAAGATGAKVLLSTVAVNLRDCAPFLSRHGPLTPAQQAEWESANARGDFAAAVAIDPAYAESHFRLARELEHRGSSERARPEYLAARQFDALRFRADARINEIIRSAARSREPNLTLADTAVALGADATSTGPAAGAGLFFEHVHLTWAGNYALARLLADAAAGALGPRTAPWLSSEDCAAVVGFTAFGRVGMAREMDALTGRPPFTQQLNYAVSRARLRAEIAAAEADLGGPGALQNLVATVHRARQRDPGNAFLYSQEALLEAELGHPGEALDLSTEQAALEPASPELTARRAFFLLQLSRGAEAEAILLQSAREAPFYFQTYALLGQTWGTNREWAKAMDYFAALVRRMPESLAARHAYAEALAGGGKWAEAEAQWRWVLRSTPDDEAALTPLAGYLQAHGRQDEAVALMVAACAYNPRNFTNNQRLAQYFDERGDTGQAVKYMEALAASGPVNGLLYEDLSRDLEKLGRKDELPAILDRGREVAEAAGDESLREQIDRLIRSR